MTARTLPRGRGAARSGRVVRLRRRFLPADTLVVLALVAVVGFLFIYPFAMLVFGAFRTAAPGLPGDFSADGVVNAYKDPKVWSTLKNSALYSGGVQVLCLTMGAFFAWVVTRTTTPLRRLVTPMMVLVFATPTIFFTIGWGMLGRDPAGLINVGYRKLPLPGDAIVNVESWYGIIGVTALKLTAVVYFLFLGSFMGLNRSLEEASRVSGAGRLQTVLRVELPVLAPAITGIAILGFTAGLSLLDIPLLLGLPAHINVFPTEILNHVTAETPSDYAGASALSMLLVVIVIGLVLVQRRLLGGRSFVTVTGKSDDHARWDIGRWKYLCAALIVLYAVLALVLPVGQLILGSLQPFFGVYSNLTTENFAAVLDDPDTMSALVTTLTVSGVAGLVGTAVAVVVTYVGKNSRSRLRSVPVMGVWILMALPGVTVGLAILWGYLAVPGLRELYSTIWILVIALAVHAVPITSRATEGSIAQIGTELEEAARICGTSPARTLVVITGRLILPSFLVGWFVAAVLSAGNLDVPILLASPDNQTLPVKAYSLYQSGDAGQAGAAFCLMMASFVVVLAAGWAASRLLRRLALGPGRFGTGRFGTGRTA
ncbi:ABC transporter permease [Actinomadura chibensis]|uniref:Iron ABC transporter permease n=1 Tax=Actinomadura chibensis TaxID=392828 RepID=A0A5D0NDH7_9ACTN|nr:iron ABC transporter permease [Actinomadura chibensis]TYB42457.1 iron ABC transporter permease [Actinomadura chibensis]